MSCSGSLSSRKKFKQQQISIICKHWSRSGCLNSSPSFYIPNDLINEIFKYYYLSFTFNSLIIPEYSPKDCVKILKDGSKFTFKSDKWITYVSKEGFSETNSFTIKINCKKGWLW